MLPCLGGPIEARGPTRPTKPPILGARNPPLLDSTGLIHEPAVKSPFPTDAAQVCLTDSENRAVS